MVRRKWDFARQMASVEEVQIVTEAAVQEGAAADDD